MYPFLSRGRDLIKSAKSGGFFGPKNPKEQIRYRNDTEIYPRFRTERGCVLITQQNLQKFEFFYCAPLKIQIFKILLGDKNATYLCSIIISNLRRKVLKTLWTNQMQSKKQIDSTNKFLIYNAITHTHKYIFCLNNNVYIF